MQGSTIACEAQVPCTAVIVGLEQQLGRMIRFEMWPLFIESASVLWGRRDFLETFGLLLNERNSQFSLMLPDA